MLFMADAERFAQSTSFLLKMAFIVIGVAIMQLFDTVALKPAVKAGGAVALPGYAKPVAVVSILLWWLAVILSGRLVAYLG